LIKRTLFYTNHFEADFGKALAWYDKISPDIGDKFQIAFYNAEERLLQNPLAFSFLKGTKYKRILFKNFPFKMVYKIDGNIIYVMALIHTARLNRFIKKRLKDK
jgi:hypothetical protein